MDAAVGAVDEQVTGRRSIRRGVRGRRSARRSVRLADQPRHGSRSPWRRRRGPLHVSPGAALSSTAQRRFELGREPPPAGLGFLGEAAGFEHPEPAHAQGVATVRVAIATAHVDHAVLGVADQGAVEVGKALLVDLAFELGGISCAVCGPSSRVRSSLARRRMPWAM